MINFLKIIVLFILSILIGFVIFVLGYMYFFHQDFAMLNPLLPVTHFSLNNAPVLSLKGKIASLSGNVAWQSRTSPIANLITKPIAVGQGEEVITQGNGIAGLIFPGGISINMQPSSDISIIQTLPVNLVFAQNSGNVSYQNIGNKLPVSIDILDLLIKLDRGEIQVSLNKETSLINISVTTGSATLAFTDINNNTQIETIENGNYTAFNNDTKQVDIEPTK